MNVGTAVPMAFQELLGPLVFTDTHPNEPKLHRWVSSVPSCCRLLPEGMAVGLARAEPASWDALIPVPCLQLSSELAQGKAERSSRAARSPTTPLKFVIRRFIFLGEGQEGKLIDYNGVLRGTTFQHLELD